MNIKDYIDISTRAWVKRVLPFFLFTLFPLLASAQNAQLVINELMQSNVEEIMDDLNEFPDSWVEIYNLGPETAILSEYKIGITNNPNEPGTPCAGRWGKRPGPRIRPWYWQ